ncbi:MAG: polyphosphate polymerase domain-containing protein [Planctomycetes bacterium]|nr:polyphosphate polymerase domain-containing protein [Planctomycetota bacterium]MCB9920321.1 polyphosphate polymerase domain-containing protein [Planctomycetota bacterium]
MTLRQRQPVVLQPAPAGRHEAKYVVTDEVANLIRDFAYPWVLPDAHVRGPRSSYVIRSVYLDSPDYRLYRSTIDGLAQRYKLRIRRYAGGSNYFLEVKRKDRDLILKSRRELPAKSLAEVVDWLARAPLDDSDFVERTNRIIAQPVLDIAYERQAFVGAYHLGTRLTFDRDLRYAAVDDLDTPDDDKEWKSTGIDGVVVELKFFRGMPGWMQEIVRRFGLKRVSFSKYCLSVQARRRESPLPLR